MKKKRKFIIGGCIIGIVLLIVIGCLGYHTVNSLIGAFSPSNERDNNDPAKRKEMVQLSTEWGRLASFPESKRNFVIKTEGNAFTRSFRGSFSDSSDVIKQWTLSSPGIQEGKIEATDDGSTHYILKMGSGATYGEVIISSDNQDVTFYIAWS